MRCKNCGWPNDEDAKRCVKCNAPLSRPTVVATPQSEKPHAIPPAPNPDQPEAPRPRTATSLTNEWSACPACGYPVSRKLSRCPGCGTENKGYIDTTTPAVKPDNEPVPVSVPVPDPISVPVSDPIIPATNDTTVTIKREAWINENCNYPETPLDGNNITLNRSNCDPDNTTIDSIGQATLVNEGGEWFIENLSPAVTTYLKVTRRMPLEDGDIIVMGNRSFTFHKK